MIRVHDLSRQFELVGQYDFPEHGLRRYLKISTGNEAAHLHKLGDKAVALCRTPNLLLFVFSLPDCKLLETITLPEDPERPLELDDLDQRFLMKDNTMMFMFHHPEFFNHLMLSGIEISNKAQINVTHWITQLKEFHQQKGSTVGFSQ